MKTIGIVQPTYLPWLPFFERMVRSDVFIFLDDVKYSKNSFHNRNAIKGPQGKLVLTVPVLYTGNSSAFINEIAMDTKLPWKRKHWRSLQQCYGKAPYFSQFEDELESLYLGPEGEAKLIDFILPFIEFMKQKFMIQTPCYRSSEVSVEGTQNQKLINLCHHFKGTHFIVKPGTEDYHPPEEFQASGIELCRWTQTAFQYSQLYGKFEPLLSGLDYLFNCGPVDFKSVIMQECQNQEVQ